MMTATRSSSKSRAGRIAEPIAGECEVSLYSHLSALYPVWDNETRQCCAGKACAGRKYEYRDGAR
jgi:hypothetical protein